MLCGWKAIGCALGPRVTVSRDVRWSTQPPMCSRQVPCSGGLKAVFSNEQSHELVFLPGGAGKPTPRLASYLCGLDLSPSMPPISWLNGAVGFALWTVSSARQAGLQHGWATWLSRCSRCSHLAGQVGQEPCSSGGAMSEHLAWKDHVQAASQVFPGRLSGQEGLVATLSSEGSYKSAPLCGQGTAGPSCRPADPHP